MLKQFLKRTNIVLLAIIVAVIPIISSATSVSAGTNDAYKEIKLYIKGQNSAEISRAHNAENDKCSYCIQYDETRNALSFLYDSYIKTDGKENSMSLRVDAPANMKGKADITINFTLGDNNLKATAKCNLIKIKSAKGISFKITDDKGNNYSKNKKIKKVLRAVFDCGMANWDSLLYVRTGYRVTGLYNNSIVKYVYHDGEWHKGYEFEDGTRFDNWPDASAYSDAHPELGWSNCSWVDDGWDEVVEVQVPYTEIIHSDGYVCRDCGAHFESASEADAHTLSAEHYSGYVNDFWDDYSIKWDEVIKALAKAVSVKYRTQKSH